MAWVALLAPWGEMLGGATHARVGSRRRSANNAYRPTPPATRRAGGGCGRALCCVVIAREPTRGSDDTALWGLVVARPQTPTLFRIPGQRIFDSLV